MRSENEHQDGGESAGRLPPVERKSLARQVTESLRQAILTGRYKPGETIVEDEVAAFMQTSRGPVRDALARLSLEGLVVREPNRRASVASMSRQDLEEVGTLRLSLELLALKFAVENATEADLATLDRYIGELETLLRTQFAIQEAVDLDLRIHETMVRASRHTRIISFWQSLRSQIWFIIFSHNLYDIGGFPRDGAALHRLIVEAIRRRDLEVGQRELERHLQATYVNLLARYDQREGSSGDRGV